MNAGVKQLYEQAKQARENSYSPYSGHKVGAAVRASDGKIYSGCNIENSSYGATICAERTAVAKAQSETAGTLKITEIVVVTDSTPAWPPCGVCRQVIAEFADASVPVHMVNLKGDFQTMTFGDLLPKAFTPAHLSK